MSILVFLNGDQNKSQDGVLWGIYFYFWESCHLTGRLRWDAWCPAWPARSALPSLALYTQRMPGPGRHDTRDAPRAVPFLPWSPGAGSKVAMCRFSASVKRWAALCTRRISTFGVYSRRIFFLRTPAFPPFIGKSDGTMRGFRPGARWHSGPTEPPVQPWLCFRSGGTCDVSFSRTWALSIKC